MNTVNAALQQYLRHPNLADGRICPIGSVMLRVRSTDPEMFVVLSCLGVVFSGFPSRTNARRFIYYYSALIGVAIDCKRAAVEADTIIDCYEKDYVHSAVKRLESILSVRESRPLPCTIHRPNKEPAYWLATQRQSSARVEGKGRKRSYKKFSRRTVVRH